MTIELNIDSDHRQALPENGSDFLEELAASLDDNKVTSVLLFGSVVTGETAAVSDIDLLVVLDDDVDEGYREAVRSTALTLAEKHLDIERRRDNPIERTVDQATGMFRSGFVVTENDIKAGRFHAIFNTSRLVYLLAPWRTVLRAVFTQIEAIYGPRVTPDWTRTTPPVTRCGRELTQSGVMATLLATAQLGYAFLSSRAIQYAMEAHKWTLYNCAFHLTGNRTSTLAAAADTVPGITWFDDQLLDLRDSMQFDWTYIALVSLYVSFVHARTLLIVFRRDISSHQ